MSIFESIQQLKAKEKELLIKAIKKNGIEFLSGYHFMIDEDKTPIIGMSKDYSFDLEVKEVRYDINTNIIYLIGYERDNTEEMVINSDYAYCGQLCFILDIFEF